MAPPGVVSGSLGEHSEGVQVTCLEDLIYPFAFFSGKAFFAFVGFWISEIIRSVGDIEIATEYHRLLFLELLLRFTVFRKFP